MDWAEHLFLKRACHTCSGISVNLCDNISTQYGNITEALVVSVTAIDEESVQLYCKLHKAWVHHRSKRKDSNKYLFIYDLRDNEVTQSAVEMMTLLKQKIQMHQDLIPVYEKKLLCTAILINSESIKKMINGIFQFMYTPCRPVRLITSSNDFLAYIASVHSGAKVEMFA